MSSGLSDPNNHVPEVTDGDDWDDAETPPAGGAPSVTVLPGRRKGNNRSLKAIDDEPEQGLRIEGNVVPVEDPEGLYRLEVQEIAPDVVRLEQDAAKSSKIQGKVTFQERPTRDALARGDGKEWGGPSKHPIKWILGGGGLILAMVLLGLWSRSLLHTDTGSQKKNTAVSAEEEDRANFDDLLFKQLEAQQIFRAYAKAVSVNDIAPMLRDRNQLVDILRTHWKPLGASSVWAPNTEARWLISEYMGQRCGILETEYPDHSAANVYFVMEGGRLVMDWKATSGFGTATFAELSDGQGDASEVRGVLSQSDFYSTVWPENEFQSYSFLSPDGEESIWCYARRGTVDWAKLSELFHGGEIVRETVQPRKVTLRLNRGPEGAGSNQWQIGEMLHIDWAAP